MELKTAVHLSADSRITEGNSRLYFKKSTVFMWIKPRGRYKENSSIHTFYMPDWITQETRIGAIADATKTK